jgi:NAD(P)-dependent dehydrogenase (short-subunit alcohol dehydrogenase family)
MTKRALITGGQQGIGLGIAVALAAARYDIVIASELPPQAEAVQAALDQLGPSARYFQHDLRDVDGVPALLDAVGPITTFISNAGVPAEVRGDMLDLTPASFDRVMAINLRGGFFLAQAVARYMIRTPPVHPLCICFVTSVSAAMASIERAEYCISKSGAAMMAQLFAARLAADGIAVFELRPGIIETGMTAAVHDTYTQRIEDGLVPARRWGKPADIGSVIVPLAEGAFGFATGAVIPVDGGLSIARL